MEAVTILYLTAPEYKKQYNSEDRASLEWGMWLIISKHTQATQNAGHLWHGRLEVHLSNLGQATNTTNERECVETLGDI